MASFEQEAKAMAKMSHGNLVGVYDFGSVEGLLYIVMEYIEGQSLHELVHGHPVDQKESAALISAICGGLAKAHQAGITHRDIKPANILIDAEQQPKIVDFGLARPLDDEQVEGVVFGTPGYSAPEFLTDPLTADHRSDLFTVGVMLYELLVGELPSHPEMLPSEMKTDLHASFDPIVRKATQVDPAQRYQDAREMANDLDRLLRNLEETGHTATPEIKVTAAPIPTVQLTEAEPTVPIVTVPSVVPSLVPAASQPGFQRPMLSAPAKRSSSLLPLLLFGIIGLGAFVGWKLMATHPAEDSKPIAEAPTPAEIVVLDEDFSSPEIYKAKHFSLTSPRGVWVKSPASQWKISKGALSNLSAEESFVAEGGIAQLIDLRSLDDLEKRELLLEVDYTPGDSSETLAIHLRGYVQVKEARPNQYVQVFNGRASNGSAWVYDGKECIVRYNLVHQGEWRHKPAAGGWTDAIQLTRKSGRQEYQTVLDLSKSTMGPTDLSGFDYLLIGFGRNASSTMSIHRVTLKAR